MNLVIIHWHILCYLFMIPLSLLISITWTNLNTFSIFFLDNPIRQINPARYGAEPTFRCSGVSEFSLPLPSSIFDSLSASQSFAQSIGLSKSPFQLPRFPVSKMLSAELSWSLSARWLPIHLIRRTFNTCVHPPGRLFADRTGCTGELSNSSNAAALSCWKFYEDALPISSVSEMYLTAVISVFSAPDYFCVAGRFWLPCHISTRLWTLAIRCNFCSSSALFFSMSLSVPVVSNSGSSPASNPLLPQANCLTMTFLCRVLPGVFDCLHSITSRPREKPTSTLMPWGMIENTSPATLKRSAYFECVSPCCRHQLVVSGNQNVLLISIRSEC